MRKGDSVDFVKKVFDVKDEPMPKGSWWWWFWLFFFDNPKNPEKPRQLMILWSTKNERSINCNGVDIRLDVLKDRMNMDGAVASWYFDGEEMHHNMILEPCVLNIGKNKLSTSSETQTIFEVSGKKSIVTIGDRFRFVSECRHMHDIAKPEQSYNSFLGNLGYSMLRMNHFDLVGTVDGRNVKGTSYFQRVFVSAPSVGWHWGTFHFRGGGILKYYSIKVLGKAVKKDIVFFDGKVTHVIKDIRVKRVEGEYPDFIVTGSNGEVSIEFTVSCYSHSSWTFRKNVFGLIPNKLVYNEYPARVIDLKFVEKKTGSVTTISDMGIGIGNAEHTTGMLL